jgi:cupin fold WbuC family metalloprotein
MNSKAITTATLDALTMQAKQSPRLRANLNLHPDHGDTIQRLAIAMEPETLVLPHRHLQTFEVLLPLRGTFIVLIFDGSGVVTKRVVLGIQCKVIEFPANTWHAVLSRQSGAVIFEVKLGPYTPIAEADVATWSNGRSAAELNAWYAQAQVGDKFA